MLHKSMIEKLNEQINLEFYSSNLYLQMSAWCEARGFQGAAKFMSHHAIEEREHMERLFTYVSETGAMPILGAIAAPAHEFESLNDVFHKTLEHEYLVTKKINELAHVAFTTQDYSTFNFLQWYVAEQHEEEKLFKGIVDKLELLGKDGHGLYLIDRELQEMLDNPEKNGSVMMANGAQVGSQG
ncbi:non-heme ferritin [Dongshaea marina]|uniref:non-heme ferritin n=1 Tax=Dongshaea marina TaxID=2047966 RepID=UPI000D3E305A|nr:non-heme ferritin [Dongshaea marina]